jgi:hypothetical protein
MNPHTQELIIRALATLPSVSDPLHRADLLQAAAESLTDPEISIACRATASCIREAERCQLTLFSSIQIPA